MPKKRGYTKTKRAFKSRYGARGDEVFYRTLNSRKKLRKKLTGSTKKIGGGARKKRRKRARR